MHNDISLCERATFGNHRSNANVHRNCRFSSIISRELRTRLALEISGDGGRESDPAFVLLKNNDSVSEEHSADSANAAEVLLPDSSEALRLAVDP